MQFFTALPLRAVVEKTWMKCGEYGGISCGFTQQKIGEAKIKGLEERSMKVLLGITQSLEHTRDFLNREFKGTGLYTEVGPFPSLEEASSWEEYMKARSGDTELLSIPSTPPADTPWYGVALEWSSH